MVAEIKFHLSAQDLADLALQRAAPLIALGGGSAIRHWFTTGDKQPIFSFLNQAGVTKLFIDQVVQDIASDLETLSRHLDFSTIKNITSIGPGLCIFELLMYRQHSCNLYLVDIEASAEHQHGFHQHGSGYSDNASARRFLEANGVPPTDIEFCNPRKQLLRYAPVDLIISNISMGFHYPVTEYVSYIQRALVPGGFLVFDRRRGVDDQGWNVLSPSFHRQTSLNLGKAEKLICRRRHEADAAG